MKKQRNQNSQMILFFLSLWLITDGYQGIKHGSFWPTSTFDSSLILSCKKVQVYFLFVENFKQLSSSDTWTCSVSTCDSKKRQTVCLLKLEHFHLKLKCCWWVKLLDYFVGLWKSKVYRFTLLFWSIVQSVQHQSDPQFWHQKQTEGQWGFLKMKSVFLR